MNRNRATSNSSNDDRLFLVLLKEMRMLGESKVLLNEMRMLGKSCVLPFIVSGVNQGCGEVG